MSDDFDDEVILNELGHGVHALDGITRPGHTVLDDSDIVYPQFENAYVKRSPYRDPLRAEMERYAQAAEGTGSDDEFYQLLEARRERIKERNKAGRQVGNPPSAIEKRLGGNVVLTPDVGIVQKPVVLWEADDDGETGPVTVTLGLVNPLGIETQATSSIRPFAYLNWGTYGFFQQAEVDVGRGCQLTINASVVAIALALDGDTGALDAQNPANLAAFLSFRQCVRTAALIRTRYIDGLALSASQTVTVPPFCNNLLPVQMSDSPGGSLLLNFLDSKNAIRYALTITNGSQVAPIPLTSDIVSVQVTNQTANTQSVRLPFELSI